MNTMTNKAPEREDIENLLPWFAAGTLSRRDAARVEEALANDTELARRFDMVREELGETIRLNESLGAPSARAMKQLFEKIEAEPVRRQAVSFNLAARVSEFMASFSPRTLAYAGGVAAIAIMLQAGVIGGLIGERGSEGNFKTVSIGDPAKPLAGVQAFVRFAPQASAADITAFLKANDATVVHSANGTFRLQIAADKDKTSEIVKKLQTDKVVSFAAPAQ